MAQQAQQQKRPVTATFRVIINGFAADLEATGTLDELVAFANKMTAHEAIQPGNSPLLWPAKDTSTTNSASADDTPICPVHGTPMKPSRKGTGWFCTRKIANGEYCRETA